MRPLGLSLLASASTALVLAASPAAQAAPARCVRASHATGTQIRGHDPVAVVFTRNAGGGVRNYYACLKAGRRVFAIPNLCCSDVRFELAGRFVAYTYQGSALGDESNKVGVLDLRTGHLEAIAKLRPNAEGPGREIDNGEIVVKLLVTATGAAFWIQYPLSATGGPPYELRGATGNPKTERIIDAGAIDPASLSLSHNHRTLLYRIGGSAKSVTI